MPHHAARSMPLICIDCRYINGRASGIAEMVSALVEYLPHLAPDLRFRFLASPDGPARLSVAPNVEQVTVHAAANGPATMWWLSHTADLRGVDLFHATFNILPAGLKMPTITTLHDLMWINHPDWCATGWRKWVRRPFFVHGIKRALTHSNIIATVSAATRMDVIKAYPDAAHKSFITASGVSEKYYRLSPHPSQLSAMGLDPSRRFILTVGQCAPYKNHIAALRAFAQSCGPRKDVDLVFVHRKACTSEDLLKLAAHLGLEGRVHVLNGIAHENLNMLYSSAAMLLHPSLYEGFGHPLAEAMACGCPVITSDRASMPEVTAGAALLVDPENQNAIAAMIDRVLDNPELVHIMRSKGLQRAAELRWEDFAQANLALYRKALAMKK